MLGRTCEEISTPREEFVILSRDLVVHERSLSFKYGRPEESCSSFVQMYFCKRRASRMNLFWSCNFADDMVRGTDCRKRAVFENGWDTLFVGFDYDEWARSPFSVGLILIGDT